MANINTITSPMDLLDEGLDEPPDKIRCRKQFLREKQRTKSPFLIGSIEDVNTRISQLDQALQDYVGLVCESRASEVDHVQMALSGSKEREQFHKRERDKKEVCQFAGVYTLKSGSRLELSPVKNLLTLTNLWDTLRQAFLPNLSSRAKNISKISIAPKENKMAIISKEEAGKPKFVELHLYPGFDPQELTPLPAGFQPLDILRKVGKASLASKLKYEQLLVSQLSQAILLDTFWYIFLQKFQPDTTFQQNLFDRVARNYVHLLLNSSETATKEIFFKAYPKLMSQAVYSSFCHSFPDSYRQFGEQFRDDLVNLVYAWMAGIRPSPRSWMTWKMSSLEPASLKHRDNGVNRQGGRTGRPQFELDTPDILASTGASQDPLTRSRSPSLSTAKSSTGSVKKVRISQVDCGSSQVRLKPVQHLDSLDKSHLGLSSHHSAASKSVTATQGSPETGGSVKLGQDVGTASQAMSPIRAVAHDAGDSEQQQKSPQSSEKKHKYKAPTQQLKSHPVGKSCDYVRAVFDIHGKSPLVEHFLKLRGLNRNAGQLVLVQRLELENLPPLDATTYTDVITSCSRSMGHRKMLFMEQQRHNVKVARARLTECKSHLREHVRRQTWLLADEEQVKRLSALIIMEQRKSQNSVTAGADAALTASLMSQH